MAHFHAQSTDVLTRPPPPRPSQLQVSPAKFAWLVHSMGVVLASLSPISSWVGLQIGYTKAVLEALGISPPLDGFLVVLRSLPFRFFPLFYLLLILIVLVSGRDFGPMAGAESGNSGGGSAPAPESPAADSQLDADPAGSGDGAGITPKAGTPLRSRNALVPFAAVIFVTFAGMILDGISKIEAAGNQVGDPPLLATPGCGGLCGALLRICQVIINDASVRACVRARRGVYRKLIMPPQRKR